VKGQLVTSVVDAAFEYDIVGQLTIDFDATRCPQLDAYLDALGYL
jgi:hypothetical protein